ncbi:hypothetical protein SUGI_0841890 [Cryptomeria japonica]|nr:hypothetical protein SUGI_0841890 [Cryptomeria japonica]
MPELTSSSPVFKHLIADYKIVRRDDENDEGLIRIRATLFCALRFALWMPMPCSNAPGLALVGRMLANVVQVQRAENGEGVGFAEVKRILLRFSLRRVTMDILLVGFVMGALSTLFRQHMRFQSTVADSLSLREILLAPSRAIDGRSFRCFSWCSRCLRSFSTVSLWPDSVPV